MTQIKSPNQFWRNFGIFYPKDYKKMHLHQLTLNKAGTINQAIYGNFSDSKAEEVVVVKGTVLELWRQEDRG